MISYRGTGLAGSASNARRHPWTTPATLLCAIAVLASACSTPVSSPTPSSAQPLGSPSPTPTAGGTVVTTLAGDPPTVNPDVSVGIPDLMVGCMVYQGLVRETSNFEIKPLLASSWDIAPDGLTYTFHLVKANWQDGQPFTSADVKYTLLNVSAKYGSAFAAAAASISGIDTPDAQTVVIRLKNTFGPLLDSLDCAKNSAILPQHIFDGTNVLTNPATLSKPVGTGAFMLKEWVRGDHLTLVRNPTYWQPNRPYLDQIIIKLIPTPAARTLALRAGELTQVEGYVLQQSDVPGLKGDSKFVLWAEGPKAPQSAMLNIRKAPYNNQKVRQALYTAVDRRFMQDSVFPGVGVIANGAFDAISWAHNPAVNLETMYPFDPAKAKSMLDAAGYPVLSDGYRFKMNYVFDSGNQNNVQTAQALNSFWRAIGVDVQLLALERATFLQRAFVDLNFDAISIGYITNGDPALGIARTYVSTMTGQFQNASGYANAEVDQLFQQGANAPSRAERAKFYFQAETILASDLPALPLVLYSPQSVAVKQFHGLEVGLDANSWWVDAWLGQ